MSTDQGAFELLPAIDLRGGQVVRLEQGDFARETAYDGDPVAVAARFAAIGATWLHVVDLDGARAGEPRQLEVAAAIVAETLGRARVEVGRRPADRGGRRRGARHRGRAGGRRHGRAPRSGVRPRARRPPRPVDGSSARSTSATASRWARAGVRARPGVPAAEAIGMLADAGVDTFEVTAIERDGSLEGPDLALLRSLVALERGRIIASGGVASIEDVLAVQAAGCAGAIVGKAIYEGRIDLRALLVALDGPAA